jgi:HD superfamily phosphodiesterase
VKPRSPVTPDLVAFLRSHFVLDWHGIHGANHWARVKVNGLLLAAETGADARVVELFAFLHDSCREHDGRLGSGAACRPFRATRRIATIAFRDDRLR